MSQRLITTSIALSMLAATQLFAQLPNQPAFEPAVGDHGIYAVQSQAGGSADPDLAKAYDNFSLNGPYELTGIEWTGIYAEPLPGAVSDVDFIVEIWKDLAGVPDLGAGPVLSKLYEDGTMVGENASTLTATGNGDISPNTATTVGGGPGADYSGALPGMTGNGSFSGTTTLAAGDYWISIIASQTFDNPAPVVDPEWQWHVSNPGGDGFYARDRTLDPAGTPDYGLLLTEGGSKDLAFTLKGTLIPEPSGMLLGLLGMLSFGAIRRKRS